MPAPIPEEKSNEIRDLALRVFKAAGCTGMSRVDFFLTDSGEVVFNEINTIPGFTSISMYPNLFADIDLDNMVGEYYHNFYGVDLTADQLAAIYNPPAESAMK